MDVSIIIPVFRRTEWLKQCITNLGKQDFKGSFEIIVVDDGSPNETEIKNLRQSDLDQWTAINQLRNRLPLWATVILMVMSGLVGSALTYAAVAVKLAR